MRAEDVEDRCLGDDGKLGPYGKETALVAEQSAWLGVWPRPGNIPADIETQTVSHHRSGARYESYRGRGVHLAAQEEF
jgi:hypothetical protein